MRPVIRHPARHSLQPPVHGMLTTMMTESTTLLIRYGVIPEVARFANPAAIPAARGDAVIVETHRGPEVGTVLEQLRASAEPSREEPLEPSGETGWWCWPRPLSEATGIWVSICAPGAWVSAWPPG